MTDIIVSTNHVFQKHQRLLQKAFNCGVDVKDFFSFLVYYVYYSSIELDVRYFNTLDYSEELLSGYLDTLGDEGSILSEHQANYDLVLNNMDDVFEFFKDIVVELMLAKADLFLKIKNGFISGAYFKEMIYEDIVISVEISPMSTIGPLTVSM